MYSLMEEYVLDPFLGTGSTALAAAGAFRNSIGFEIDGGFRDIIFERLLSAKEKKG